MVDALNKPIYVVLLLRLDCVAGDINEVLELKKILTVSFRYEPGVNGLFVAWLKSVVCTHAADNVQAT
jgi:hypothetical protein